MKASKFFRLKQEWQKTAAVLTEAVTTTVDIATETVKEEVVQPVEQIVEQVKEVVKPKKQVKVVEVKEEKDETVIE